MCTLSNSKIILEYLYLVIMPFSKGFFYRRVVKHLVISQEFINMFKLQCDFSSGPRAEREVRSIRGSRFAKKNFLMGTT